MSRPENVRNPYCNVVNGGIIDFQDTLLMNQNFVPSQSPGYCMSNQGFSQQNFPIQSFPNQCAVQYANQPVVQFPNQQIQTFNPTAVVQPNAQSFSQPNPVQHVIQASHPNVQQCISGPPSFIHLNGQTYKPVDAVAQPETKSESKNLQSSIEGRVNEKVNEFMLRQERSRRKEKSMDASMFKNELARLNEEMRRSSRSKKH